MLDLKSATYLPKVPVCDVCGETATAFVNARNFGGYRCDAHVPETVAKLEAMPREFGTVRVEPVNR
jgi:hypothetical protein